VPAKDKGTTATVTIGGVARDLNVTRPKGIPPHVENAFVVLRPDALELSRSPGVLAWRGRITNRRFAGGIVVYRVQLADGVIVDVESQSGEAREDDNVSISPLKGPFPLVPA
jgi:ABC-type Fe3+/spermidine/putrescine transport system ATPase subunit